MKDLGLMHYFLGLEVWQSPEEEHFGMLFQFGISHDLMAE
jgi:hypothetical protein